MWGNADIIEHNQGVGIVDHDWVEYTVSVRERHTIRSWPKAAPIAREQGVDVEERWHNTWRTVSAQFVTAVVAGNVEGAWKVLSTAAEAVLADPSEGGKARG